MKNKMLAQYTPGPWAVDERNRCEVFQVDGGGLIAIAGDWYPRGENHPAENMQLIAAAPDLYEALDRLLTFSVQLCEDIGIGVNADAQKQARAALQKAVLTDGQLIVKEKR